MTIKAKADTASLLEDTTVTGNLLANDTGTSALKWIKYGNTSKLVGSTTTIQGLYGTLTVYADGSYSYTADLAKAEALAAGAVVTERFGYTANDQLGNTSSSTLTFTITGVNDNPVISIGSGDSAGANLTETNATLTAAGNLTVTDVDTSDTVSSTVTKAVLTGATGGLVEADVKGLLTLTPATGLAANAGDSHNLGWQFNSGSQAFDFLGQGQVLTIAYTISVSDGHGGSATQQINVTITGTNDAPVASADAYAAEAGVQLNVSVAQGVLANDHDAEGSALHAVLISGPSHGTLHLLDDGSFDYTAAAGYTGPDSFTYEAFDGAAYSAATAVTLSVTSGNTAPVAANDSYNVTAGTDFSVVRAGGVLANDSDADGNPLEAVLQTGPANGSLTLDSDGSFIYTAVAGFTGTDSFTYKAFDGTAYSNTATVSLVVSSPNAIPVASDDVYSLNAGSTLTKSAANGVLANDSDADNNVLQAVLLVGPSKGTLALNADGSFTYTPIAGFTGTDSFTYRAFDGHDYSAAASAELTVNAIPTPTTVVFQDGLNGYAATLDTTLDQAKPTTSFGSDIAVSVDKADAGVANAKQALLCFDNLFGSGPGQIPVGATITSATLTLQTNNESASAANGAFYRMLVDWTESATWNSMVGGVQANGVQALSVADVTVGQTALGPTTVDVTASLRAWATAGTTAAELNAANQGWLISTGSTDAWRFDSSEGSVHPKLAVTYLIGTSSMPVLGISDAAQTEGPGANITFHLSLDHAASQDIPISYSIIDGTATVANDLLGPATGIVTISAGQTSLDLALTLKDDTLTENTESFSLKLNSANGAFIAENTATGTIYDNDPNPVIQASVVAVTDLTTAPFRDVDAAGAGIGDPSGLAYDPVSHKLFIADSEHDERPWFSQTNLFSIGPTGATQGYSLESFTFEPTGLGINPSNGHMYISDDDQLEVFWVDPANPTVKLGSFDTASLGQDDSEDLRFDPTTGHIFELDGHQKLMYELTGDGALVRTINLPSVMHDAEALAYDPTHGIFFVASGLSPNIWEMDQAGDIISTISVLNSPAYTNPITGVAVRPKGLELAPSSDPNDGQQMSLYVADYGVDQVADGRLFEIHLGSDWLLS
ncbi:tandem-95 repeat protein [Mesorhizobium sp. M2E.F.Ca.ET.209.01.1.1]|uniref:Ig-like domain-containing protein n=1 Tax=Mesorhizobium sp. M2E.F.Ca.ET.209.01.1.1 TaxID=2500526 RepID=UPI000FDC641E|nr:Ig-like domain-containing protein [Mesorhizobium sp. M2E.F.Ca.ET.209.01.1.1]TGS17855.1 tandem-95 repeat protein [Mesorhizobium sp. M2E.F.Ca.ET.209.01.1.1]